MCQTKKKPKITSIRLWHGFNPHADQWKSLYICRCWSGRVSLLASTRTSLFPMLSPWYTTNYCILYYYFRIKFVLAQSAHYMSLWWSWKKYVKHQHCHIHLLCHLCLQRLADDFSDEMIILDGKWSTKIYKIFLFLCFFLPKKTLNLWWFPH